MALDLLRERILQAGDCVGRALVINSAPIKLSEMTLQELDCRGDFLPVASVATPQQKEQVEPRLEDAPSDREHCNICECC